MRLPKARFGREGNGNGNRKGDDDGERRTNSRRPIDAAVIVTVAGERHDCRLSDVGPGGAYLRPRFDAEIEQVIMVSIPASRVSATARVRRLEADGLGIEFDQESGGAIVSMWTRGLFR